MPDARTHVVTVDVRDDIREGRSPLPRIMDVVLRLREGESILVIAPFEPRPLISLLTEQGFTAQVTEVAEHFEIMFTANTSQSGDDLL